ncbi:FadR family transcriptional regulator [Halovulum dunhuangense]|uniref:FadR family transcriptional regulator n=1 Tax=Halovulum dunhuangense TaxID=1505036 RepID=A0A849L3P9_9RHOB|nr:FCD domain-containing protein [Halovulum dunhuangense]NNU80850.1 FadR family transcriptional regulator [Halovulum dunhuangense]
MTIVDNTLAILEMALDRGDWAPGERLPPERTLAARLGVGRSSLRKALAELERQGRIRRHVGQGTFVAVPPESEVVATLRLTPPPGPADVLELRLMIEPAIAALVALRGTVQDIARLRALIEEGAAARDWEAWEDLDSRFHARLAQASRNPLLTGVLETTNVIRRQGEWGALRSSTLNPERQRAYTDQHRALVDAIARRDAPGAAAAMRAHLAAVQSAMTGDAAIFEFSTIPTTQQRRIP